MAMIFKRQAPKVSEEDVKLAELILYVANKCKSDLAFGAVKLNKVLFYADFESFRERGKAITGAEYMKLEFGPAPRHLVQVRSALVTSGACELKSVECGGHTQVRLVPLRAAKVALFTKEDLKFVDSVIESCEFDTASALTAASHKFIGWEVARMKEVIPYATVYVSSRGPNKRAKAYAERLAQDACH